jgi:hypothetical protein
MSDLASLMKIAPGTASFMMGQNQAQTRESEALKQRELQGIIEERLNKMRIDQDMAPLKQEHQRLQNSGLQEGLAGITATSRKLGTEADLANATYGSDVASKVSTNETTVTKNNSDQLTKVADAFGKMGAMLENEPEPTRAAKFRSMMEQGLGNSPQAQQLYGTFSQVPSAKLPAALRAMAEQLAKQSPAYTQAMDVEAQQGKNRLAVTDRQVAGASALEDKRIAAGKYDRQKAIKTAEQTIDETISKALQRGAKPGHAALVAAAEWARQNNIPELSAKWTAMAEKIRPQAEAEIKSATPGSLNTGEITNLPTNPGPNIAPGGAAAPAPSGRIRVVDSKGKTGTIPAAQLQDALKQGYKEVK